MKEFIEKLIERLEEYIETAKAEGDFSYIEPFEITKNAVNQLAEEYNNDEVKGDLISKRELIEKVQMYFSENRIHQNDLAEVIVNLPTYKGGWIKELLEAKKNCSEDSDCSKCPFGKIEDRCILAELQIKGGNNGWIPCSERLPEEHDSIFARHKGTDVWNDAMFEMISDVVNVTVADEQGKCVTTYAHTIDGKWSCDLLKWNKTYRIVAWMPLPEPCKESED